MGVRSSEEIQTDSEAPAWGEWRKYAAAKSAKVFVEVGFIG
jgi:hypothetical protein